MIIFENVFFKNRILLNGANLDIVKTNKISKAIKNSYTVYLFFPRGISQKALDTLNTILINNGVAKFEAIVLFDFLSYDNIEKAFEVFSNFYKNNDLFNYYLYLSLDKIFGSSSANIVKLVDFIIILLLNKSVKGFVVSSKDEKKVEEFEKIINKITEKVNYNEKIEILYTQYYKIDDLVDNNKLILDFNNKIYAKLCDILFCRFPKYDEEELIKISDFLLKIKKLKIN